MRLLMFEHCSLCFRVRMMAALKALPLHEQVVRDDDSAVMIELVGRRVIPILVKDDGQPMLESMDMVDLIESLGPPVLTGQPRPEIAALETELLGITPNLTMPRYAIMDLPEFSTPEARQHFIDRKRPYFDDFETLRAATGDLLLELYPVLDRLAGLIDSSEAINGDLSRDDIRILPLLRSVAVVAELQFPPQVQDYFDTMMDRIGHAALPTA